MFHLIIADNKPFRAQRISDIVSDCPESELIIADDATMSFADLEQFLYPSLFSFEVPVILARFFLDTAEIDAIFAKKIAASPTIFLFEEIALPATTVTMLKKAGAIVHEGEKKSAKKSSDDVFAVTACITEKDKKSRWLSFRAAMEKQPIEAVLGILYWKVRTLAARESTSGTYTQLYRALLEAQARAWKTGAPLEALIEKVILTQK